MGSRTPDIKEAIVPSSARLLRPRGICYRCHQPNFNSCVCHLTSSNQQDTKLRSSSALLSPENCNVNSSTSTVRKKKPVQAVSVARSRMPSSSRRQLFKGNLIPDTEENLVSDIPSSLSEHAAVLQDEAVGEGTVMTPDDESSSSLTGDALCAVASTSTESGPSTSDPHIAKAKRRKKKLKLLGRHVCRVCSKIFETPGKLNQHMFSHTGEKPFECEKCRKAFSSKFKLVRHLLIHSDERQYHCTMCDRTFHRKDHLKNHCKVHSPVKKTFRCDRPGCLKVYSSFLSYRKHAAVHSAEEGDLDCKMCGKSFVTKDEIVYHLKVHAGSRTVKNPSDKKYRCDFCDRRFFTRKDVRRHLVVHTGKRDFLCQFCPQRFGRKDHLVRHIKKSHSNVAMGVTVRSTFSKGKRLRASNSETTAPSTSTGKPKQSLKSGRVKGTTIASETINLSSDSPMETEESVSQISICESTPPDLMLIIDPSQFTVNQANKELPLKEQIMPQLKVEDIIESQGDSSTFHVKVEDCLLYSQPPPPYPDHLSDHIVVPSATPDHIGVSVKTEPSLSTISSIPVTMDMNQFMSGLLSNSDPNVVDTGYMTSPQHEEVRSVSTGPQATEISDAETSEFLTNFPPDDDILQLMELSLPSTSSGDINQHATTSCDMEQHSVPNEDMNSASTSNCNLNQHTPTCEVTQLPATNCEMSQHPPPNCEIDQHAGPLPRFNQAFQQQPPP